DPDVLSKYCVGAIQQPFYGKDGASETKWCATFPWMARKVDIAAMGAELATPDDPASSSGVDANLFNVVRLKVRAIDDKSKQRLVPKGGSWGLFGWNTIPHDANSVVVTEGEFDAMAVHQATGRPAISLPNGCRSLPPAVLPLLERFSSIYLWMDSDVHGQESVDKFVAKLGVARTYVVRASGAKDANDALLAKMDLNAILDKATLKPHAQITTFDDLRAEVRDMMYGVQSRSIPALNSYLKGFRSGELTVVTGPTGCGKTTLLSQLSLDWCAQGVSTLWGSFEIKNTRLVHKMLTQMAGRSLALNLDLFERTADEFEALPMYFLRFFGSSDVDEVLDAMEYAVYAYDVQHVILDNVQFMMSGQGRGYDKFERQDAALDKFRKFATAKNVHVTLVIHPRKEQDDTDLTLSSVFGTAKATQEADNVLILQRNRGDVKLDVRKNRYYHFSTGAVSGGLSAIAFQPLDVIRTHQQGKFGSEVHNVRQSVQFLLAESGVPGLWRGTTPTLLRVCGGAGLYFGMLEQLQVQNRDAVSAFLGGALARSFAGLVMSPLTIVKARMEWDASNRSIVAQFRSLVATYGWQGLYRGVWPTLLRDVPFSGLYVTLYTRLKNTVGGDNCVHHPVAVNFSCGVVAGVSATVLVHPFDVVKTRMQLEMNGMTVRATMAKMFADEGVRGFLRGVLPRVFKRTLGTAITWTMYEYLSTSSNRTRTTVTATT
ncbi:hypothetical protein DYB28_008294, partial [Aphanomyces astaci]